MTDPAPAPGCPKDMVYGPCGGVSADGGCEIGDRACVFVGRDITRWPGAAGWPTRTAGAAAMATRLAQGRVVVADFPARAMDVESLLTCADTLVGRVDAVLVGDSGNARVQFPPAYRALLIAQAGLPVWSGLNCRDRNRVALEGEIAALAVQSVAGVHCVTGDHPLTGSRPDAAAVFDLDSVRLAEMARRAGHLVSVAEAPASPPVALRPVRLAEKVRAGADVCFVNHCGPAEAVDSFLAAVTSGPAGAAIPSAYLACVPVVVDVGSAELLRSFPSLVLPDGFLHRILRAGDPEQEGIRAAIELAQDMLSVPGVRGVNLSGGPTPGAEMRFAAALAEIGATVRG